MKKLTETSINNIIQVYLSMMLLEENVQELVDAGHVTHGYKRKLNLLTKHLKPEINQFWKSFTKRLSQIELAEFSDSLDSLAKLFNSLNGLTPTALHVLADFSTRFKKGEFTNAETVYEFGDVWLEFKFGELCYSLASNLKYIETTDEMLKLSDYPFTVDGVKYTILGFHTKESDVRDLAANKVTSIAETLMLNLKPLEDEGAPYNMSADEFPSEVILALSNFVYTEFVKPKVEFEPDLYYIVDRYNGIQFRNSEVNDNGEVVMQYKHVETLRRKEGKLEDIDHIGFARVLYDHSDRASVCVGPYKILVENMTKFQELLGA